MAVNTGLWLGGLLVQCYLWISIQYEMYQANAKQLIDEMLFAF